MHTTLEDGIKLTAALALSQKGCKISLALDDGSGQRVYATLTPEQAKALRDDLDALATAAVVEPAMPREAVT